MFFYINKKLLKLVSYLNIGAIPDPNFADQQLQISDSFFTTDFWFILRLFIMIMLLLALNSNYCYYLLTLFTY
jgi:hypothetical protein